MRIPEYLSPTSISLFNQNVESFYLRYLTENEEVRKAQRFPQTQPMAIGSAFDAFVKCYLYERLFGKKEAVAKGYHLEGTEGLFNKQVEDNWTMENGENSTSLREWAWKEGDFLFNMYREAGCLADLVLELDKRVGKARFEFSIKDYIDTEVGEIPLLGKPDIFFINSEGARVILDWKVNGYCSKSRISPMKGYVKLKQTNGDTFVNKGHHKQAHLMEVNGVLINIGHFLEDCNKGWADQLSIYSWLLGEPIGSEAMIVGIDQLLGNPNHGKEYGDNLRFATHRLRISKDYQFNLFENIKYVWEVVNSGWIFRELSEKDSKKRCELLDSTEDNSELDWI